MGPAYAYMDCSETKSFLNFRHFPRNAQIKLTLTANALHTNILPKKSTIPQFASGKLSDLHMKQM